jgi:hypothetical protein
VAVLEVVLGFRVISFTLWDVFETIVLPRTVRRRFRPSRLIYTTSWLPLQLSMLLPATGGRRDAVLSIYGPLLLVFILLFWVISLIVAFGLIYHASAEGGDLEGMGNAMYFSGTTFFTLGLGDLSPQGDFARLATVVEAGTGFGLLALVIGYLPIFYQAFSRREVAISLLDARAGSPPTAFEFIRRNRGHVANQLLPEWERWVAELLEGHLSYPALVFFRSQRTPVLAGGADHDPGHVVAHHGGRRGGFRRTGALHLCDGPAHAGGPVAGFLPEPHTSVTGPPESRRLR